MSTDALEQAFANLEAEVERNETVDGSAGALIEQFAALVEANKNSPARIQALVDRFRGSTDTLVQKVSANTPAEQPPAEEPPTEGSLSPA